MARGTPNRRVVDMPYASIDGIKRMASGLVAVSLRSEDGEISTIILSLKDATFSGVTWSANAISQWQALRTADV
jgi:hypothetical protein